MSFVETCAMSRANPASVLTVTGDPRQSASTASELQVPQFLSGYNNYTTRIHVDGTSRARGAWFGG